MMHSFKIISQLILLCGHVVVLSAQRGPTVFIYWVTVVLSTLYLLNNVVFVVRTDTLIEFIQLKSIPEIDK